MKKLLAPILASGVVLGAAAIVMSGGPARGADSEVLLHTAVGACEHAAEQRNLRVDRVLDTRPSGENTLDVVMRLGDGREVSCTYDGARRQVTGIEQTFARGGGGDERRGGDGRLATTAAEACERAAERQNLRVDRVLDTRSRGENNIEVLLRGRDGREVSCTYDGASGQVRNIEQTLAQGGGGGDDGRLASRAAEACERAAEQRDLRVDRVLDTRPQGENNVIVVLGGGDGRQISCTYDGGSGEVRDIEQTFARGDDGRLAARAAEACERAAERRDLRVDRVLDTRPRGENNVEVVLGGRDGREVSCTYDGASGEVRSLQ